MSFLKGVFGGRSTPVVISGADTVSVSKFLNLILNITSKIERLCERVQSSLLLDDRRDAVKAIRSLSKVNS
jgi:hypothetical protein